MINELLFSRVIERAWNMALESGGRMNWRGDPLSSVTWHRLFSGMSRHGLSVALLPDSAVRRNECTPDNAGRGSGVVVSHCREIRVLAAPTTETSTMATTIDTTSTRTTTSTTATRNILLTQNETASAKVSGLRRLGLWLLPRGWSLLAVRQSEALRDTRAVWAHAAARQKRDRERRRVQKEKLRERNLDGMFVFGGGGGGGGGGEGGGGGGGFNRGRRGGSGGRKLLGHGRHDRRNNKGGHAFSGHSGGGSGEEKTIGGVSASRLLELLRSNKGIDASSASIQSPATRAAAAAAAATAAEAAAAAPRLPASEESLLDSSLVWVHLAGFDAWDTWVAGMVVGAVEEEKRLEQEQEQVAQPSAGDSREGEGEGEDEVKEEPELQLAPLLPPPLLTPAIIAEPSSAESSLLSTSLSTSSSESDERSRIGGSPRRVVSLGGASGSGERIIELPALLQWPADAPGEDPSEGGEEEEGGGGEESRGGEEVGLESADKPWERPQREQQTELAAIVSAGPRKRSERGGVGT